MGALLLSISAIASERILLFKSDITVYEDTTMLVTETIKVRAQGEQIRHGILREFPTSYKDRFGNNYHVAFNIKEVVRNGTQEPYHVQTVSNGKKVYIGSKETFLPPGEYTYTITYLTSRQLGFFKNHDELYWNVTGNGWRLPIDKAIAIVKLPKAIARDQIALEGYTGYGGSKEQNYNALINAQGNAEFETTTPLKKYQGLTIVVTWPKGYIHEPSFWQKWRWFFEDNLHILIALLGFFFLLLWYLFAWMRFRKTQYIDTVIPLFHPPKGMMPGLVCYIVRMGYNSKVLAADIVNMAVQGLLTIEYNAKSIWGSGRYTLHKKDEPTKENAGYMRLFQMLFSDKKKVSLDKENAERVGAAIDFEKKIYRRATSSYFTSYGWNTVGGVFIGIIFFLMLLTIIDESSRYVLFLAGFAYVWFNIWFSSLLRGYTKEGLRIKKEIDGFKMFLATTEKERMKLIGTPPTKTPELYEKYLPYAIALGVEQQWSRQFAPLFDHMREAGNPYVFLWLVGVNFYSFQPSSFASNMSSSINSAISSSSSPPGSSSGSGGGGSYGGGGGGGGGGGW